MNSIPDEKKVLSLELAIQKCEQMLEGAYKGKPKWENEIRKRIALCKAELKLIPLAKMDKVSNNIEKELSGTKSLITKENSKTLRQVKTTNKKIDKLTKEREHSISFKTNYIIELREVNKIKGNMIINDITIDLTPLQFQLLMTFAKKILFDKQNPPLKQGWLSYGKIIDRVELWESTTTPKQVRTQIGYIRNKLEKYNLNRELLENDKMKSYRISSPPGNISIKI
jgi:hypothetical protein